MNGVIKRCRGRAKGIIGRERGSSMMMIKSKSSINSNSNIIADLGRSSSTKLVTLDIKDQIATIAFNHPSKLNALTVSMGKQFESVVNQIIEEDYTKDIRAVILTGTGTKAFSAGGDLKWLEERTSVEAQHNVDVMRNFYSMYLSIRRIPVPVISAINGSAIGASLCLAMATDLRIAAREAKLGFTFATLGLHPGMAGTHFLPRLISPQIANKLLLTGEVITGEEACRLGLVLEAVPQEDVMKHAHMLATSISKASPLTVRSTLKTLRSSLEEGLDLSLQREADAQAICYKSQDYKEGLNAVATKKTPIFRPYHQAS